MRIDCFVGNGDLFARERERGDRQEGGCESNKGTVRSSEVAVRRILTCSR